MTTSTVPLFLFNGSNPVHIAFGQAIRAESFTIKEPAAKKQMLPIKAYRLLCNSLSIPSNHHTVICESCYYYPAIKKYFGLGCFKSKIINVNCGPLLYHLYSGRIKSIETSFLRSLLKEVDAHLVFGNYGLETINRIDPGKPTKIIYPFVSDERFSELLGVRPNLDSNEITIIANDDIICKGFDLLIEAFNKVTESKENVKLNLVTNIEQKELETFYKSKNSARTITESNINYLGKITNISEVLGRSCLYVHPSRGDTFPRASIEAMLAGVPAIVSEETGTKELVADTDSEMICKIDSEDLAERIIIYLDKPASEKKRLSKKIRTLAEKFNRTDQLVNFKKQFESLI